MAVHIPNIKTEIFVFIMDASLKLKGLFTYYVSRRSVGMWIKRTIDSNLTVYVKQSHKTCKLDPNK